MWIGTSPPAAATECVESPFLGVEGIIEGRIAAIRQTSRRILFWGSNDWEARVVSIRPVAGKAYARRFTYYASDRSGECMRPVAQPKIGQVRLFAVTPIYARRANTLEAHFAMTWPEYHSLRSEFLSYAGG